MAKDAGYALIRTRSQRKLWGRAVGGAGYRRLSRLGRHLGDTCWLTANGQSVCGAGDPTGQTTTITNSCSGGAPAYVGSGSAVAPDRSTWLFQQSGTQLIATAADKIPRYYTFLYTSPQGDVYQYSSGGKQYAAGAGGCYGFSCAYIVVGPGPTFSFTGAPPACAGTATVGTSTPTCTVDPYSGQEICNGVVTGNSTVAENVYPSPVGYSSGYPYSPIQLNTGTGYTQATTAAAAAPATGGGSTFSNIPTWALVGGGLLGGVVLLKVLKK